MKEKIIRITSLFMALILVLSCAFGAFAASGCGCGTSPLIVVSGMGAMPLIENQGETDEKQAFPPETDEILKLVAAVLPPVGRFAVNHNYDKLGDGLIPPVRAFFEPLACNPDGSSKHNVTAVTYPESIDNYPDFLANESYDESELGVVRAAADKIGGDHVYYFNYDWRLDPMDHAKELHKYVERAKAETGHKKVSLAGVSMGGTVISAYLALYGSDDIDNFTMLSSAFTGTTIVGDLFNGKVEINKEGLVRILKEVIGNEQAKLFIEALDKGGVFDVLLPVADDLILNLKDRVYEEVFRETFVSMPGIWALIALEDYDSAKAYLLDPVKDAQFIKRADAYHYGVQAKLPELLSEAKANGVKVNVVSHYNLQGVPVTPSYREHNDNVIDTKFTSGYASCAYLGETLPGDYKQQNTVCRENHSHISADRIIDASTCLLPENTWFLKNLKHVAYIYDTPLMDFVLWLCLSDSQRTVGDPGIYSQFMDVDYPTGELTLIGAEGEDVTQPPTESETENGSTATDDTQAPPTDGETAPSNSESEPDLPDENGDDGENTVPTGDAFLAVIPLAAVSAGAVAAAKKKRR